MEEQPNIPNNSEIEQALKEFESKSNEGKIVKENHIQSLITPKETQDSENEVEGVSFNTDTELESYRAIKFYKETVEPKMVKAVIKFSGGAVKNQRQAEWILFGFVIAAIIVSLYLVMGVVVVKSKPPVPSITGATIKQTP